MSAKCCVGFTLSFCQVNTWTLQMGKLRQKTNFTFTWTNQCCNKGFSSKQQLLPFSCGQGLCSCGMSGCLFPVTPWETVGTSSNQRKLSCQGKKKIKKIVYAGRIGNQGLCLCWWTWASSLPIGLHWWDLRDNFARVQLPCPHMVCGQVLAVLQITTEASCACLCRQVFPEKSWGLLLSLLFSFVIFFVL